MIDPDIEGNTILHYLVVTQQIKCIMSLPLNHRRQLLITMRNGQSGKTETGLTCIELSKARSQEEDVKLLRTFDKAVPKQSREFMINFLDQSQERSMTGDCYYR